MEDGVVPSLCSGQAGTGMLELQSVEQRPDGVLWLRYRVEAKHE